MAASALILADFVSRVEGLLKDAGNLTWSDAELQAAIRLAMKEMDELRPREAIGTITLAANGREIGLSTLTGLRHVTKVWWPYTAADKEYPPNWVPFEVWADGATLFINSADEPTSGDVVRVFYNVAWAIKDLDSATATTVWTEHENPLVLGGAGYAALARSAGALESVGVSGYLGINWWKWGEERVREMHSAFKGRALGAFLGWGG